MEAFSERRRYRDAKHKHRTRSRFTERVEMWHQRRSPSAAAENSEVCWILFAIGCGEAENVGVIGV